MTAILAPNLLLDITFAIIHKTVETARLLLDPTSVFKRVQSIIDALTFKTS